MLSSSPDFSRARRAVNGVDRGCGRNGSKIETAKHGQQEKEASTRDKGYKHNPKEKRVALSATGTVQGLAVPRRGW